jgi:hypothetical protein
VAEKGVPVAVVAAIEPGGSFIDANIGKKAREEVRSGEKKAPLPAANTQRPLGISGQ